MDETTKPTTVQRFRIRFGLRSILAVTALFAVASAWLGSHWLRTHTQRPIVAQIEAARGLVLYDYQISDTGEIDRDATPPGWQPLRTVLGEDFFAEVHGVSFNYLCDPRFAEIEIERFPNLRLLNLQGERFSDNFVKRAVAFKKLSFLNFSYIDIRPETLDELATCQSISQIGLEGPFITPRHLRRLKNFPRLNVLRSYDINLSQEGLSAICEIETLRTLHLGWNRFHGPVRAVPRDWSALAKLRNLRHFSTDVSNDTTVASLSGLIELQSLDLKEITDRNIPQLKNLINLQELNLVSYTLSDIDLETIANFTKLESVDVRPCEFTNGGIRKFARLRNLKSLKLTLTANVTHSGVEELRTQLPHCKIETFDMLGNPTELEGVASEKIDGIDNP
ncbi:MAG: hypothetical protein QM811_08250 [Pirellulales bacterium]